MSNHRTLKYRFVQVIGRDLADLTRDNAEFLQVAAKKNCLIDAEEFC